MLKSLPFPNGEPLQNASFKSCMSQFMLLSVIFKGIIQPNITTTRVKRMHLSLFLSMFHLGRSCYREWNCTCCWFCLCQHIFTHLNIDWITTVSLSLVVFCLQLVASDRLLKNFKVYPLSLSIFITSGRYRERHIINH